MYLQNPDLLRLVFRILSHVWITCDIGNRDRVYVEFRLDAGTTFYTTLEVPKILGTCEESKADQIRTAASFYVELTTPLVNQSLFIYRTSQLFAMSTVLDSLDVFESVSSISQTIVGLCTCQVNFSQAEQYAR